MKKMTFSTGQASLARKTFIYKEVVVSSRATGNGSDFQGQRGQVERRIR